MGYLKSIGTAIIYIGFFFAVITFLPGLPPEAEFSEYSIKEFSDTNLQFELKNRLRGAEVLFAGEFKGPESFASYNGELYTGISGGYVVKIDGNNIVPVVKFGQKCEGLWQEEKCGRPLGLKFNNKGELFVADAYYGIFKVNVNTQQFTNIVNTSKPIDGKVPKIVNSLDVAKNGDIYWTDSSIYFSLHDGAYSIFANPSGRLIRYNAATKKNEVLIKNLGFANGILLADDESFVIVLECHTSRIIKYHLKGPKTGQHEIFAEALPGFPDNVHTDGQGGFLISIIASVDSENPCLPHSLIPHPYLRKMISRFMYLIEAPFKLLKDVYPNYYAERVIYSVGSFETLGSLDTKKTSIVLRMDKTGNIMDAIYSDDGTVHDISSAYVHNGYLWLGSPWNEYLMRVPLNQAFPHLKESKTSAHVKQSKEQEPLITVTNTPNHKVDVKPSKAKPAGQESTLKPSTTAQKATTTTSKPTTTTPKPTTTTPKPTTTTPKPTTTTPKPTTTAPKPTTQKTTTEQKRSTNAPKPPSLPPSSKAPTVEIKQENLKEDKKGNSKKIVNENLKEVKKESSTTNANPTTTNVKTDSVKKNREDTMKSKSEEPAKRSTPEGRPEKSKPIEKNSDSIKK
nr:adipocyte plasma membrane-associated protein-like [Megalopta genalis]